MKLYTNVPERDSPPAAAATTAIYKTKLQFV